MTQEVMENLQMEVKHRLIDFLKAEKLPYYEPSLTACPHCGRQAGIIGDFMWSCNECGSKGDVVDYAKERNFFKTRSDALKHVCRVLGIKICHLDTISADELMDKHFPPDLDLIDGLMSKGLYILAGAPKIGKSWLVLWLAHCVSTGEPVWEFETYKSPVLYLCLEDPDRWVQKRLVDICGGQTGSIHFAVDAEALGSGLEEQLGNFIKDHPSMKLIIIDTFQKIRNDGVEGYNYGADYNILTALKRIADRFDISILLVHHTRKQGAKDVMDTISGTRDISGCVDGTLVLEKETRLGTRGKLSATSREYEDKELILEFDRNSKRWALVGSVDDEEVEPPDPLLLAISEFIGNVGNWKGTATELLEHLKGINGKIQNPPNALARYLNANSKQLRERYGVEYAPRRERNVKYICLEPVCDNSDTSDVSEGASNTDNTALIGQSA